MNSGDLQQFIEKHGIVASILPLDGHTSTAMEAAHALGVDTDRIIKSLVFRLQDDAILVINNWLAKVDRKKLAAFLNVGRKRIKFTSPEQALEFTGYVVGSMPPFGHRVKLRTLIEASVTDLDVVYGGGGSLNTMIRLTSAELVDVTEAEVLDLSE